MKKLVLLFILSCCICPSFSLVAQISFVNRSNTLFYQNAHSGAAMAVSDVNGDGLDDIIRLDNASNLIIDLQTPVLDPNFSGLPTNISNTAPTFWSICLTDYNRDGYMDIGLGENSGYRVLEGTSTPGGFNQQFLPEVVFSQASNFADINNDGQIDLFVCDDLAIAKAYRLSDGSFVYDTSLIYPLSTVPSDNSGNYGSVWTDYDSDGDLDLYISKCRLGVGDPSDGRRLNLLFQNNGAEQYTDRAAAANLLPMAQTWSSDFADIDNDGDLDVFLINHDQPNQLLINNGNGFFTDISSSSGVLGPTTAAGDGLQCRFADFDNDGFVDLLYTSTGTGDALLRNNGNQTFTDQSALLPLPTRMHTAATGDLNNDGFIDIIIGHGNGYNLPGNIADQLLINNANSNNYLKVKLEGVLSNKDAIGARLELYGSWGVQVREVRSGESYGIMHSLVQHFGLGPQTAADSLVIRWPSGVIDVLAFPIGNQLITIEEGQFCVGTIDFAFTYTENAFELALEDISTVGSDSVFWTFGDGQVSSEPRPVHQYAGPGSYIVCLTVFGLCDTAQVCKNIPLVCNAPESVFSFTKNGLEVSFQDFSENDPINYFWTFGDGTNSMEANPVHLYNDVGTYQVCLLTSNDCGSNSECINLVLGCENFAIDFAYTANELTLAFNGSSVNGLVNAWSWTFGDGTTGQGENTAYTYPSPGQYTVCLTTEGSCGSNTTCQQVSVNCALPGISFDTSSVNLTYQFSANSTEPLDSIYWTFGDGVTASGETPTHTYTMPGNYEVCMEGISFCGSIQFCNTIQVTCPAPTATFGVTVNELSISIGQDDIEFVNTWMYNFGDGNTASTASPTHTYSSPGTYQVCQTIEGVCGSDQTCKMVTVNCAPPVPLFDALVNGLDVFFTDESDNTAQAWLWDFGDLSLSTQQNPTHTYTTAGTYNVCLTVSSFCGSDQYCQTITVSCAAPTVAINQTQTELSFQFANTSDVSPTDYLWTFGDGQQSTDPQPQHTYSQPGTYMVCLTVANDCSQNMDCVQVVATCPSPQVGYGFQTEVLSITLSSNINGSFDSLYWNFGSNGAGSNAMNPSYTYAEPGTYEVCLTAYSICGNDQFCQDISLNCTTASATFTSMADELNYQFSYTGTGVPGTWQWDFGDGNESNLTNPNHTYSAPGTYEVCLTVIDACGSDQSCTTLEVNCTAATAEFSFQADNLLLSFIAEGPATNTIYTWDFGDNTTSNQMNPLHVYDAPGSYTVCLVVSDICGFTERCETIVVECPFPNPDFAVFSSELNIVLEAEDQMAGSHMWTLGDGSTAEGTTVNYTFAMPGTYEVCLSIENDCASVSNCQQITVSCTPPSAQFTVTIIDHLLLQLTALDDTADTYTWTLGDGNMADSTFVEYEYEEAGTYEVCLATSNECSTSTFCQQITLDCVVPTAQFTYETTDGVTQFMTDSTSQADAWLWTFGDGGSDTTAHPQYIYTANGVYTVCLTATNICGSQTTCEPVNVIVNDLTAEPQTYSPDLYPNPAQNSIWVRNVPQTPLRIDLYHTNGALIQKFSPPGVALEHRLDIQLLPPGAYYLVIYSEDARWVLPFVK